MRPSQKISGLIEPPPKMLLAMSNWVLTQAATYYRRELEKEFEIFQGRKKLWHRSRKILEDMSARKKEIRKIADQVDEENFSDFFPILIQKLKEASDAANPVSKEDLFFRLGLDKDERFFNSKKFKKLYHTRKERKIDKFLDKIPRLFRLFLKDLELKDWSAETWKEQENIRLLNLSFAKKHDKAQGFPSTKATFQVNLTGWKYKNFEKPGKDLRKIIKEKGFGHKNFGEVEVEISFEKKTLRSLSGFWESEPLYMQILVLPFFSKDEKLELLKGPNASLETRVRRILKTVRHESIHMAQTFLELLVGNSKAGLPTKDRRFQGYIQGTETKDFFGDHNRAKKKLEVQGLSIKDVNLHSLDDIEFYTKLADQIDTFLDNYDPSFSFEDNVRNFMKSNRSNFLRHLRKVPDQKYKLKKALKLFYKAAKENFQF